MIENSDYARAKKAFVKRQINIITAFTLIIVALVALFLTHPDLFKSVNTNAAANDSSSEADSVLRGLPAEDFFVINDDVRLKTSNYEKLFSYGVQSFIVVKVNSAEGTQNYGEYRCCQQYSVTVLQNIYGNITDGTMDIYMGPYANKNNTNTLRVGGVYILPLMIESDKMYVQGDTDFLFEVDDHGCVWSHSEAEDFSAFDGADAADLISYLLKLTNYDDFMFVNSSFHITQSFDTLCDITVEAINRDDNGDYSYDFTLNEVLSEPTSSDSEPLGESRSIMYSSVDKKNLEPGKRYLIFLESHKGKVYTDPQFIAQIEDDGTIKAIPSIYSDNTEQYNVFEPYNGKTIDYIKNMVSRIKTLSEAQE